MVNFEEFLEKRVLIVGEVGSGKTRLLSKFLDYLIEQGYTHEITLIEMAPGLPDVGRRVEDYTKNVDKVRYLKPEKIIPPRLLGRNREEVLKYAEHNYREVKKLFEEFSRNPTEVLLVNDVTIFLHAGDPREILKIIENCSTFAATAYEGIKLKDDKGSGVTHREKAGLEILKKHMDLVISLTKA